MGFKMTAPWRVRWSWLMSPLLIHIRIWSIANIEIIDSSSFNYAHRAHCLLNREVQKKSCVSSFALKCICSGRCSTSSGSNRSNLSWSFLFRGDGRPMLTFPLRDPAWHHMGASLWRLSRNSSFTTWKFTHSDVCLKFSEDKSKCVSALNGQIKREKPKS